MKYLDFEICLTEIPDEISLGIICLGCNVHCPDCHSKHTWDINSIGKGKELKVQNIYDELDKEKHITCILFFGGEWSYSFPRILEQIRKDKPSMKLALYSGNTLDYFKNRLDITNKLDYLKVGPYNKNFGGLRSPRTNQRLYEVDEGDIFTDITYKFQVKHV